MELEMIITKLITIHMKLGLFIIRGLMGRKVTMNTWKAYSWTRPSRRQFTPVRKVCFPNILGWSLFRPVQGRNGLIHSVCRLNFLCLRKEAKPAELDKRPEKPNPLLSLSNSEPVWERSFGPDSFHVFLWRYPPTQQTPHATTTTTTSVTFRDSTEDL